jgi:ubiquinone/menaquinone biosynthesis C-methylase UbiE
MVLNEFYRYRVETPSFNVLHKVKLLLFKLNVHGEVMIDIGCGDGTITKQLAKSIGAKEVWGVDISERSLAMARSKGIKTLKLDVNHEMLPFPDNTVDVVTGIEIIEHLINPDNFLKEAYRVLKDNGYLILSTPNLGSWLNRLLLLGYTPAFYEVSLRFKLGKPFRSVRKVVKEEGVVAGHLRLYTLKALIQHLSIYGFSIIKIAGASVYGGRIVGYVDKLFERIPSLASDIIIIAKKTTKQLFTNNKHIMRQVYNEASSYS